MLDTKTMNEVAAVGSKLAKEALLEKLDDGSLKLLRWALDPAITFGVIVDDEQLEALSEPTPPSLEPKKYWIEVDRLLRRLQTRELTGNAAVDEMAGLIEMAPTADDAIWTCRIINKDLRAGFSVSTLNKAHPGFLEPFAVALAKPYEPDKHEIGGAWCVEPKLDGLRMVVIGGQAFTRNGRDIESVGHILEELKDVTKVFVLDGEVMGATEFNEDSGKIRKKGEGPNLELRYNVFDAIRLDEWSSRKTREFKHRRYELNKAIDLTNPKYTKFVESRNLKKDPTAEELFAIRDYYIGKGYEGAMIKNLDAPYVFKRSDNVLKLKTTETADGVVKGWYEGKGRHKGRLGGFNIEFDGVETKVGGGFSDEQRTSLWNTPIAKLIGKMVEVEYQNKTPDGSLRFPVFIKFRPDKD